MTLSDVSGYFW